MKIEHVHIYGFGKWLNRKFSFTSSSFQYIVGVNEAGKSTLRQFILFVLFGHTSRKLEAYIPKHGVQIGGRITISGIVEENITVERIHGKSKGNAKIFLANGEIKEEEWLKEKWRGIDRTHYEAIYTFDAMELQKIQQLNNEALNEVLLAIGMTGSDRIYYTEKQLDKQRAELFKPYGKKPVINHLFDQLKDLKEKLAEAKREEATYLNKLEDMEELENYIKEAETKLTVLQDEYQHYEKKRTQYQMIESYFLINQQLKRLQAPEVFPVNGLSRYSKLKEELLPIQSEEKVLQRTKQELIEQAEQVREELLAEEKLNDLKECAKLSREAAKHVPIVEQLEKEVKKAEEELKSNLQQLGVSLSSNQLADLPLPFHLEELWSGLAKQQEQLQMEKQYIEQDIQTNERILMELEESIEQESKRRLDDTTLTEYKQDIELSNRYVEKQNQMRDYQKLSGQLKKWSKLSFLLLMAGTGLTIYLYWQVRSPWAGVIVFLAALPFAGLKLISSITEKWFKPKRAPHFNLTEKELEDRKRIIEDQQVIKERLSQLESNRKKQTMEQLKIEERYHFAEVRLQQLKQKIRDQIREYPFLQTIQITYWPKLFQQLVTLKEQWVHLNQKRERLLSERQTLEEIENELNEKETGEHDYYTLIDENQKREDTIQQLEQQIEKINLDIQSNMEKQKPYLLEMDHLFKQANVADEEAFFANGKNVEEKQQLEKRRNEIKDSLSVLFDERELALFAEGKYEDDITLKQELQQLDKQIVMQKETLAANRQKLSDIRASLQVLESKEDASLLKHRYDQLKEQVSQLAKEWAVNQIAAEKIAKAKAKYYADYIPKIFQYASEYFAKLTKRKYKEIFVPGPDEWIKVRDTDGMIYTVEELSQGTKDQLYISLRFALSKVVSTKVKLPFLIDDGFVHFDTERKELMVQLLEEICKEHQVVYFTTNAPSETALVL
ncbi:Uncharacterized protein YhaN [Gracilibacillus ureilyticus]|uniref:Uncharacterized protein YhaN n=1 Tax=Gracilibacillus ureilyticus TaxID=531814 RepID=A0A1H9SLV3_9BACI|nr:AAA family ATPase [Gracilibacillus ureilyticus]SER85269.1 Uncharacterized protein YhaN [Gracilibacillus ureilyticus]